MVMFYIWESGHVVYCRLLYFLGVSWRNRMETREKLKSLQKEIADSEKKIKQLEREINVRHGFLKRKKVFFVKHRF